ncbi:MAG: nitroreductase family protein [Christensenellales bacterium]|jgi:nitroreductase
MSFTDIAISRRSVRKFLDESIAPELIDSLLIAAQAAPSAGNRQPWHFYAISDRELIGRIANESLGQSFAAKAPLMIVVCADAERSAAGYGQRGRELYCLQDTAAAVQNILLCAHDMGLGACWCGAFSEENLAERLDIPAHLRPVAIIPVGHPAHSPAARPRRPLSEIVTFID